MKSPLDAEIHEIKESLLTMARLTEQSVMMSLRALTERNDELVVHVEAEDAKVDQLEVSIDESVVSCIARYRPVAHDLRFMIATSKIVSDLERIGDQSVNIARLARKLNKESQLGSLEKIHCMSNVALEMLREAIRCFVENDVEKVSSIIRRDDQVDEMNRELYQSSIEAMAKDPTHVARALNLLLVGRNIERIADHCKNLVESVFFLEKAVDIRHSYAYSPSDKKS
ncbi:MAG: phosphate signaling complex protein PhoU [Verrucomicrobiia bacterium]